MLSRERGQILKIQFLTINAREQEISMILEISLKMRLRGP